MALMHIFGNKPIPKVLDFFTVNQFWDYSLRDVSRETGISYRTLQIVIPSLVKKNLLKYTRTEGKAKLYQINKESAVVRELQKISRENDFEYAGRTLSKDKDVMQYPAEA